MYKQYRVNAPGTGALSAYYPWNSAHEPATPIGAYYAWDSAHEPVLPTNPGVAGLGVDPQTEEAARQIIEARQDPVTSIARWAKQQTDIVWDPVPNSAVYELFPLNDALVDAIPQAAFGHPLPQVAVIGTMPHKLSTVQKAFEGTPYKFEFSYAVYGARDRRQEPAMLFLWTATPRGPEDEAGGRGALEYTAGELGGKLVYPVQRAEMSTKPVAEFYRALDHQFPVARSGGLSAADAIAPPAPAIVSSKAEPLLWLGLGAATGAAIWGVLHLLTRRT